LEEAGFQKSVMCGGAKHSASSAIFENQSHIFLNFLEKTQGSTKKVTFDDDFNWALEPCTHKNLDAEEDSCPIVNCEIVNDWLSSLPKERSQPIVNPSELTTGHEGPVHCSPIIQIVK